MATAFVTQTDYDSLSWHQRQALNARLRAETRDLEVKLAALSQRYKSSAAIRARRNADVQEQHDREYAHNYAEAERILAALNNAKQASLTQALTR